MARKKYYHLIQQRVAFLRKDGSKTIRMAYKPPTINELGDVFEHVYTGIESERNSAVKYAFKACKLDLDNPFHWADLLRALCELSFTREQTQNQKRDKKFFAQLKRDRAAVFKKYPSLKQLAQAEKLKTEFASQYGHLEPVTIRRLFSEKAKRPSPAKRLIPFKNRS
jgi:hypothetical protein